MGNRRTDPLKLPTVYTHKAKQRDYVRISENGKRTTIWLGPTGSQHARERLAKIHAHIIRGAEAAQAARDAIASEWPTVQQLVARYLIHCHSYYVNADGERTKYYDTVKRTMQLLIDALGHTYTDRLSPNAIEPIRVKLIESGNYNRQSVNGQIWRIKQAVAWGVEKELVPTEVQTKLSTMRGIPADRFGLRETNQREAASREAVEATLPFLAPALRAAVMVQVSSGARPGEVIQMTRRSIDTSITPWIFRPHKHKTRHKGKDRRIELGPRCRELLSPIMARKLDPDAALISPRDTIAWQREQKRKARKSPMTPSQRARDERNAAKLPSVGVFYTRQSYTQAVERACKAAKVEKWTPHQLRHLFGTELALTEGQSVTQDALGHSDRRTTLRYIKQARSKLASAAIEKRG